MQNTLQIVSCFHLETASFSASQWIVNFFETHGLDLDFLGKWDIVKIKELALLIIEC